MTPALRQQLGKVQLMALGAGVLGLLVCLVGAFVSTRQFFASYLFGYLFWLGLALGCMGVAMIHHLTGGRWGFVVRRFLEAGLMTLPLMVLLFVPLFFGLHDLYPWAKPGVVLDNEVVRQRHVYLNSPAFIARALFFFAIWIVMAFFLRKWSLEQDDTLDPAPTRRLRTLSGPGIVIYPLTATFAYVDWIMSLEKEWYSTIFLVIVLIGQILATFAFVILLLYYFRQFPPLREVVSPLHYHHLGNLLLTFVMFWTYVAFSQVLIIFSGNLPHEISWYLHRIAGHWKWVVGAIAMFHFFLPFILLLFRENKRRIGMLTLIAAVILVIHIVNVFWLVMPSIHTGGISISWLDFAAPIGVGGIWIAVFLYYLKGPPLLPCNDPRLKDQPHHAG